MNEAEFDALYDMQWSSLVAQVSVVCGDTAEAADCVQEAFVRAWEHRRRLDADAGGWVRTAALRIAVSRWRKARNAMSAWTRQERLPDVAATEVGVDVTAPVWRALAALPSAQREALVMHHVLDLSVDHVAAVLGCPVGTVKARLSRGRAALAVALTAAGPTSADDDVRPTPAAATPSRPEGAR